MNITCSGREKEYLCTQVRKAQQEHWTSGERAIHMRFRDIPVMVAHFSSPSSSSHATCIHQRSFKSDFMGSTKQKKHYGIDINRYLGVQFPADEITVTASFNVCGHIQWLITDSGSSNTARAPNLEALDCVTPWSVCSIESCRSIPPTFTATDLTVFCSPPCRTTSAKPATT